MKSMKKSVNISEDFKEIKIEVEFEKVVNELSDNQIKELFDSANKIELILRNNKRVIVSKAEELVKLAEQEYLDAKQQQYSKIQQSIDLQNRIENL